MAYQPRFEITSRLLNFLTQATALCEWISRSTVEVAWLSKLQKETALRLAHSSTAIEGNPLSLEQVQLVAEGDSVFAGDREKKEILDYLRALKWIEKQPMASPFTEKKLLHLHRLLTQNTLEAKADRKSVV